MKQSDKKDDIRIYVDNEIYTCINDDVNKWMNTKTINVPFPRKTTLFSYDPKPQVISDMVVVYQKECIKYVEKSKIFFEIYYNSISTKI